jgi:mono/diheme cytochrome c family protein
MASRNRWLRLLTVRALALFSFAGILWTARFWFAYAADGAPTSLEPSFTQQVKPFLEQNCVRCHNADTMMSGVRVDQLDATFEDRHLRLWEGIRKQIGGETMPPKGQPQPASAERQRMVEWITHALDVARSRPAPKNGLVRRLTVSQYRNTLRALLLLDDDLTETLPPDAVSRDGFVNNTETLQLSPLLMEAFFDISERTLNQSIVDPKKKPAIQNFRVDLGAAINPEPLREELVLGADSLLLNYQDFVVTQLTPGKPFAFEPYFMQTRHRFIEGYAGNDTVRGWREFDSIYHSVFACMRGNRGYPKGSAYSTVPQGLLLRPAIPSDEIFGGDGTYGPKANFKISLRELPDYGRFRVIVMAAKYNDGLLLDPGQPSQPLEGSDGVIGRDPKTPQSVTIKQPGIYQVDVYAAARSEAPVAADSSRLGDGLGGFWPLDGSAAGALDGKAPAGRLEGDAQFVDSPFGQAVGLDGDGDSVLVPRQDGMNVADGDFTVAAWIHPRQLRTAGIVALGVSSWAHGWYLDMPDNKGGLRIETAGPDNQPNGTVSSPPGVIRAGAWQHVAAVVRRGKNETRLYVNGYAVGKGEIGPANLDNPRMNLHLGRIASAQPFQGELDEVRLYRRALGEAEIQALLQPGRQFVQPPPEKPPEVTLTLGGRQFSGTLPQPAFLVVRLAAGVLPLHAELTGVTGLDRIVLTPLAAGHEVAQRFLLFEKRAPRLGVHLGLRRDCGSTLSPVGAPQTVASDKLTRLVFEGAIRNFPSPDVEKDNVNYLAGIREIAVRSEYTDGRDMPRLLIRSVEFEGPLYETWPPPAHRNIFIDSARKDDQPAYAREIIRKFAARAYRRPATAAEESALMAVFRKSFGAGRQFQESVKDALQVALTSPQFLFLIENSSTPEPEPLDNYELASKLSYFLWNGPPDRTALKLAASGTLRKQLDAEVARMIDDPRFSRFSEEFTSQWLSLDKFQVLEPDRSRFPKLTRDTRTQLKQEPVQFLQYLIRNNLPVRSLIASDFVIANEVVASYYDLAGKTESGFQFAPIPHGRRELGGVLTQAAIMAGLSDGRESNPVKRGAWLARRIIAEPPDDPPPNVPTLPEDTRQLSLRERLEQHRNQPGCAQCHAGIDPWGVAFEEFDAGGRLKLQPVSAHSKLPDNTEVEGVEDLKRYLSQDRIDQVAFSVLKHLATYATGRSLTYNELNNLKRDGLKLKAGGYRMKDMIGFVINSRLFLEK